jgi:hypothetical protein
MGKPEKKAADQQLGGPKLGLGPLIAKPGKSSAAAGAAAAAAAGKQQLLGGSKASDPASLDAVRQLLTSKLKELQQAFDQGDKQLEQELRKSRGQIDAISSKHMAQANQVRVAPHVCCCGSTAKHYNEALKERFNRNGTAPTYSNADNCWPSWPASATQCCVCAVQSD